MLCCRRLNGPTRIAGLALVLGLLAFPALAEPGPVKIGEIELVSMGSQHPYRAVFGEPAWERTIAFEGATYIRVHFSAFDLAPGDYLEISSPDGSHYRAYTRQGIHGDGSFWAFTVPGDTAILRLFAETGDTYGFEIDQYGRGFVDIFEQGGQEGGVDSVCGTTDWQDVACYETSYPTEWQMARGAVKLIMGGGSSCTGFKVSDEAGRPVQFMTNNHCTSTDAGVKSTEVQFYYERPGCNSGTASPGGSVMGSALLRTDYTLDYTLFEVSGDSSSVPCLGIDNRLPPEGERLYIAGHPSAGPKKLSIESTHPENPTGLCEVDDSPHPGRDATSDVGYYCDTTNGSSGSPVLSGDTHQVVAIHHYGGCLNSGVRMDRIYGQISGLLATCSGGGGEPPVCGDGTCNGGETGCDCPEDCGTPPLFETSCTDGLDEDCDGVADCDDSDCSGDPACSTCLDPGDSCSSHADCCSGKCKGSKYGKVCT